MQDKIAEATIAKVDEDKRLVFGWASIIKDAEGKVLLDRQDDYIDSEEELEKAAYSYVLNSRDGGEMHVRTGVSTMIESVVFSKEKQAALGIPEGTMPVGWWIGFRVNDDRVWDEVKKGGYSGFSVHGTGQRQKAILKEGEYTEVEKHDSVPEEVAKCDDVAIVVEKRLFTLLAKAQKKKANKIATVMREFKAGKLKSSTGEKVTDPKQAMAIAISEQKRMGKGDYSGHPFRGNQNTGAGGTGRMGGVGKRPPIMAKNDGLEKHARHNQKTHGHRGTAGGGRAKQTGGNKKETGSGAGASATSAPEGNRKAITSAMKEVSPQVAAKAKQNYETAYKETKLWMENKPGGRNPSSAHVRGQESKMMEAKQEAIDTDSRWFADTKSPTRVTNMAYYQGQLDALAGRAPKPLA